MTTYEGWTNYQTWSYSLWLNKNQELYKYKKELIRQAQRSHDPVQALAESLEEFIQDSKPELEYGIYKALLNHALTSIDFHEIAEHELED